MLRVARSFFGTTTSSLSAIEKALGYTFADPSLLETALLHRGRILSPASEKASRPHSNERLEWLGDAVLELVVREKLFHRYPDHFEGQLTVIKQSLVSAPALSHYFRVFFADTDPALFEKSYPNGMSDPQNIEGCKARAFEAILGAIFLDSGGLKAVDAVMTAKVDFDGTCGSFVFNWKSELLIHAKSHRFETIAKESRNEYQVFTVSLSGVFNDGRPFQCTATGRGRKEAEMNAARMAVQDFLNEKTK